MSVFSSAARVPSLTGRRLVALRAGVSLAVAALVMVSPVRAGVTLHVDRTHPRASSSGPGIPELPFNSIQSALLAVRDTGTIVVVHPGIYRERVAVPLSGSPERPLVIRASGPGVVIDGADELGSPSSWLPYVGDVWMTPSVTWSPLQVFADGKRLAPGAGTLENLAPGTFRYEPGSGLFVNIGGGNPGAHAAAAGRRSHGFLVSGKRNVVIDGFEIMRTEEKGVEVLNSQRVTLRRNRVSANWGGGIGVEGGREIQVFGNVVSDNNHHGILFRLGVTNSIIDDNESFANAHLGEPWATGIYLSGSPGNLVECNRVHDNQDSGLEIQTGSDDNVVRQNMSWANGDHGFSLLYATGNALVGNVAYGNRHEGFSIEGGSTGTRVFNSIATDTGRERGSFCLFVDSTSTAGFETDYNLLWNTTGAAPVKYGRTVYASVQAFRAATGLGVHTEQADARFLDPARGDFHLRPDSPAIDAATSSAPGWDESDAEGHARFDSPGVPNTGEGAVSFADRGAIEYRSDVLAVGGGGAGAGLSLAGAYPNPTRRGITFALQLGSPSPVRWSVFDVLGRQVWSDERVFEAGRQELRWPLTDARGHRVAEGIYLVRAEHAGASSTLRFVVLQ